MRKPVTEHNPYSAGFELLRDVRIWLHEEGYIDGEEAPLPVGLMRKQDVPITLFSLAILAWRRRMGVEFQNRSPFCFAAWDLSLGKKRTPLISITSEDTLYVLEHQLWIQKEREEARMTECCKGSKEAWRGDFGNLIRETSGLDCTFHFSHEISQSGHPLVIDPVLGVRIKTRPGQVKDVFRDSPALLVEEVIEIKRGIAARKKPLQTSSHA